MAKQLDLTTSLGNCLVGMRYMLVDITLKCNMYIIDIDALTFSLRDITYEPHLGVNKADQAKETVLHISCMYGTNGTDEGGCTITETLGKSVGRVCKAIMSNISYSLQPSAVSIPLLLLHMANAMVLA